jgi:tetratricopeptide (TPR) repeat protein
VTLDTTRADAIGPDAPGMSTPSFNAIAARGLRFRQAYATAPQTLPSHCSMMTGLYPAAHGVHENARYLGSAHPLVAETLRTAGYRTAAFVSAYPLARQFGLSRGFDIYDDALSNGQNERAAKDTTDRALAFLQHADGKPLFLWVHYFEPHYPYEPPVAFRSRHPSDPYRGEIEAMDRELGRLVKGFDDAIDTPTAIIVAGDHGEGLGEHGEAQHGNLLYQGVMRVPLVVLGPGVSPGVTEATVSLRRIYHTLLDWAAQPDANSLRAAAPEIAVGEAMQPFLQYGWQPQVMAVENGWKFIHAGRVEAYDLNADPSEARDLAGNAEIPRAVRQTLREYPIPSAADSEGASSLTDEERRRLASLGYITSEVKPVIRRDAPRPRDMAPLFDLLDRASGLFVREQYQSAIPLLETILEKDPNNLSTALRLAAAHSALGHNAKALAAFGRAGKIAPDSTDVAHYLALHHLRAGQPQRAGTLLERVLRESPDRLPSIEALATVREREHRFEEALALRRRALSMKAPTDGELLSLGALAMAAGNTPVALEAFENARAVQGEAFTHDLDLGVLYLDAGRLPEARASLDRVPASHPAYPMALFKRAQVSVLLREVDAADRIERAREHADETTRPLIARERLFHNAG